MWLSVWCTSVWPFLTTLIYLKPCYMKFTHLGLFSLSLVAMEYLITLIFSWLHYVVFYLKLLASSLHQSIISLHRKQSFVLTIYEWGPIFFKKNNFGKLRIYNVTWPSKGILSAFCPHHNVNIFGKNWNKKAKKICKFY